MPAKQKETGLESIACSIIDHVTSNNSDRKFLISWEVFMAHISESRNGKHNLGITQSFYSSRDYLFEESNPRV